MKKIFTLFLIVLLGAACNKNSSKPACSPQLCTSLFASITIHFTDSHGQAVDVTNYRALDLRTGLQTGGSAATANLLEGYYIVADDTDLKNLATEGDDIRVTATNPATNETKIAIIKVAGGCLCHVSKVSGTDHVIFK
jgi:hypothetical protein